MKYTEVRISTNSTEQNDILVALLADAGYESFEEEEHLLKAFIKEAEFNEAELNAVTKDLALHYTCTTVAQQNWNAAWESSFEPVIIHNFAAIRAGFHQPVKDVQHEIIITPKMSFGTGHHSTTYLMMEQMSKIDFAGKTVLDFGTGTGVLAILAEKMGAKQVVAIDNDDWSIDNAIENLDSNQAKNIQIQKAETAATDDTYDMILANINLNVITANMATIASSCNADGLVLLSGFLFSDEQQIRESLQANHLHFQSVTRQKDWICVLATK